MAYKLLVVDDDEDDRFLIEKGIKEINIDAEIIHAESGEVALKAGQMDCFDLAIVDVNLGDRKGYDVCRDLKNKNLNIKTIIYTGVLESLDAIKVKYADADNYCIKTPGNKYLLELVQSLLGEKEQPIDNSLFLEPVNHILIIENDVADLTLTKISFEDFEKNFNFYEFFNGEKAFEFLNENQDKIDLIITSLNIPIIDGFQLVEMIRSADKFSHIPIIILITQDLEEDTLKAFKRHNVRYIYKTPSAQALKQEVPGLIK